MRHPLLIHSAKSITLMRRHGLSDFLIAGIISDIRADAIFEEQLRLKVLHQDNPPAYPETSEIEKLVAEYTDPE